MTQKQNRLQSIIVKQTHRYCCYFRPVDAWYVNFLKSFWNLSLHFSIILKLIFCYQSLFNQFKIYHYVFQSFWNQSLRVTAAILPVNFHHHSAEIIVHQSTSIHQLLDLACAEYLSNVDLPYSSLFFEEDVFTLLITFTKAHTESDRTFVIWRHKVRNNDFEIVNISRIFRAWLYLGNLFFS